MNKFLKAGKKGFVDKLLVDFLFRINQVSQGNSILVFHEAIYRLKPILTIVLRRVGRRIYEVPVPLDQLRQYKMVLR